MSENIQPINVEEIMKEIRDDIEKRNLRDNLPDFSSIVIGDGKDAMSDGSALSRINNEYFLSYYTDYTGNPLKNCFKKIIRKMVKFLILPLVEQQNLFNEDVVKILNETSCANHNSKNDKNIELFMSNQEYNTEKLETKILMLESRIEELEQRLNSK